MQSALFSSFSFCLSEYYFLSISFLDKCNIVESRDTKQTYSVNMVS